MEQAIAFKGHNEILAFDTDLIGCYGMCCDVFRTWWIGDQALELM